MDRPMDRPTPTSARARTRAAILSWTLCAALAGMATAAEVKHFRLDARDDFLAGTLDGVGVGPLGGVRLAARLDRVTSLDEPFVFAAAPHPDGWVVGTGNDGRVLIVEPTGAARVLFAAPEAEVFAVWADPDGTVFAGTSPEGKVYRIGPDGEATVFFDPEETYVWRLARAPDGALLVATGLPGRLYHVASDGTATRWIDSGDAHVRAIAVLPDGRILAGTAGQGLVLERGRDGGIRNLHDATHPEVLDFAVASDGTAYVALLASEASWVDLSAGSSSNGKSNGKSDGDSDEDGDAVSVGVAGATTIGSRGAGFGGPRSVIGRIEAGAGATVETIASFEDETVHALLWTAGGLWVGTGQEGGLYRWHGDRMMLEHRLDERQITALVEAADGRGPGVLTTNAAALYHLSGGVTNEGTFTSGVLDTGSSSSFGTFTRWGTTPGDGTVAVAFRTGMSGDPDATWSPWSEPVSDREVPLTALPAGRYVQWRAVLRNGGRGAGPRLDRVELSYRQLNRRPRIESFVALDPGEVLVPANFNPQNQTFEPWSPNRDGIFTTLSADDGEEARTKTLWKKGYRTLRWTAKDPNEDSLRYTLAFRRDGDRDGAWLPVASNLEDTWYSFDATALPDGSYRFRLTASDERAWTDGGLAEHETSPPVVIDHTAPVLVEARMLEDGVREVELRDAASPLREVTVSFDGQAWEPVVTVDGLLDGRFETMRIEPSPADPARPSRLVLLRVMDAAFNVVTFDLSTDRSP